MSKKAPLVEINVGADGPSVPEELAGASPRQIILFALCTRGLDVLGTLAKWGAIAFCFYQATFMVASLSGKNTAASFLLSVLLPPGEDRFGWVWPTITIIAAGWALVERVLGRRKVKYLAARVSKYEKEIDPCRTSSGLAETGATNPKDE